MQDLKITVRERKNGEKLIRVRDYESLQSVDSPILYIVGVAVIAGFMYYLFKETSSWFNSTWIL